jgi:hypothetical protein
LWRWVICTAIHSYDATCKEWKRVCLHIRDFTQTLDYHLGNNFPVGVPGGKNGQLGPLWFEMLPWLNVFSLAKVLKDKTIITASNIECVIHFIQSRVMPPPPLTEKRFDEEVLELRKQFLKKPKIQPEDMANIRQATGRLITYIKKTGEVKTRPHISLSASGKLESARTDGGGAIYAARKFLARFVWNIPKHSYIGTSWWGCPINEVKGIKPYKTVARESSLQNGILFLTNSFRDEMAPDELMMTILLKPMSTGRLRTLYLGWMRVFPINSYNWPLR